MELRIRPDGPAPPPRPDERHGAPAWAGDVRWMLAIFVLSMSVYLPTLFYPFLNWDDTSYVSYNPWLYDLTWERLFLPFRRSLQGAWTPLPVVGHLLLFQAAGLEPAWYRAANILAHAGTMVALFALARRFGAGAEVAFGTCALVALHPLRIESVVWISEFKDVLCNLFYAWGLWCWTTRRQRAALLLHALALMSKPMAVSFPVVLLLHDALLDRPEMRRRIGWYAATAALAAVAAFVNMRSQQRAIEALPLFERLATAAWSPVHVSWTTLWPWATSPLHPRELRPTLGTLPMLAGFAASSALVVAGLFASRRKPRVAFGVFAAGAALAPVSGLVSFGYMFAADRFSYLPTLLLAAALAPEISTRLSAFAPAPRRIAALGTAVVACVLAASTVSLSGAWRSDEALWSRTLDRYPGSAAAREFLGLATGQEAVRRASPSPASLPAPRRMPRRTETGAQDILNAMQAAVDGGNKHKSLELAERLLAHSPTPTVRQRAEACFVLAWAGEEERARNEIAALGEPTFGGARALAVLARRESAAGRRDEALRDAREALRQIPFEEVALAVVGDDAANGGDRTNAERILLRARKHPAATWQHRRTSDAWLATIAKSGGDGDAAARLFAEAFPMEAIGGRPVADTLFLARLAESVGQPRLSKALYDKALARDPANVAAARGLEALAKDEGAENLEAPSAVTDEDPSAGEPAP